MITYFYNERGDVRCENKFGLAFTLPGSPVLDRPRGEGTARPAAPHPVPARPGAFPGRA